MRGVHARRRVRERLHVGLNRNLRATIIADIKSGRAEYLYPGNGGIGRQVFRVSIRGRMSRVVYEPKGEVIVTVMGGGKMVG